MFKYKLNSYFFKQFFSIFLLVLLSFSLLIWLTQATRLLKLITEFGNPISTYIYFLILNYPKILNNSIPISFLISLFFFFTKIQENNELNNYLYSGLSKKKLVDKIILITLLIFIGNYILSSIISPISGLKGREILANSKFSLINSIVKEKNFNSPLKGLTVYVSENNQKGDLRGIFIYEKSKMIFAEKGQVLNDGNLTYLKLENGITHIETDNKINQIIFKDTFYDFSKYNTKNITYPKFSERSNYWLFQRLIKKDHKKLRDIREEINQRLIKPLSLFIIAILGCFIIYENKNKNYKKFKIIIYFISFLFLIIDEIVLGISSINIYFSLGYLFFLSFLFLILYLTLNNFLKKENF